MNDAGSMAGLLEIIVILWKSIHRSMERNKEARLYTIDKFASVLPQYLKVFQVRLALVCRHVEVTLEQNKQKGPAPLPHPGASSVAGGLSQLSPGRKVGL